MNYEVWIYNSDGFAFAYHPYKTRLLAEKGLEKYKGQIQMARPYLEQARLPFRHHLEQVHLHSNHNQVPRSYLPGLIPQHRQH